MSRAGCAACGQEFSTDKAFDRHRIAIDHHGNRRCLTPEEMLDRGWIRNRFGRWTPDGVPEQRPLPRMARSRRRVPIQTPRRRHGKGRRRTDNLEPAEIDFTLNSPMAGSGAGR